MVFGEQLIELALELPDTCLEMAEPGLDPGFEPAGVCEDDLAELGREPGFDDVPDVGLVPARGIVSGKSKAFLLNAFTAVIVFRAALAMPCPSSFDVPVAFCLGLLLADAAVIFLPSARIESLRPDADGFKEVCGFKPRKASTLLLALLSRRGLGELSCVSTQVRRLQRRACLKASKPACSHIIPSSSLLGLATVPFSASIRRSCRLRAF